jgi:retinol dehydrogenase-12
MGPSAGTPSAPLPPWLTTLTAPVVYLTSIPAASGALTSLLLATDPDVVAQGISGRYFDVGPLAGKFWYGYSWDATDSGKLSGWARDEGLGEELWRWSLGRMRGAMGGDGEGV